MRKQMPATERLQNRLLIAIIRQVWKRLSDKRNVEGKNAMHGSAAMKNGPMNIGAR